MTAFWVMAVVLAAGALAFVLPPLLRTRRSTPGAAADATNVAIYRDQLREMDADLAAGTLARDQYDDARRELEARLLDDVRGAGSGPRMATPGTSPRFSPASRFRLPRSCFILPSATREPCFRRHRKLKATA